MNEFVFNGVDYQECLLKNAMTISLFLLERDCDIGDPVLQGEGLAKYLTIVKKEDSIKVPLISVKHTNTSQYESLSGKHNQAICIRLSTNEDKLRESKSFQDLVDG